MSDSMPQPRPSALTDAAAIAAANASARNIFGRPQYSWMQASSVLSQPPLRAGKHAKHVQPAQQKPSACTRTAIDSDTGPSTVPLHSSPIQDDPRYVQEDASDPGTFLPSPAPSDQHEKSPNHPAARHSPDQPAARLKRKRQVSVPSLSRHASTSNQPLPQTSSRHASISSPNLPQSSSRHATMSTSNLPQSSSRHATMSTSNLPQSSAANSPTMSTQPAPRANDTAPPFGPEWSVIFQADECSQRVSDFASAHQHLTDADLERLGILYDAIIQNDWYFILLLMLLSCHSLNHQSLHPLLSHLPQHALPMFARLLGEQWDEGSALSSEVLIFISSFPRPLPELRRCLTDQSFMIAIRHIAQCLYQITLNLDGVMLKCRQAETLPTVHDLIDSLGIRSLLFQRAAFSFLLRNTWGSDGGPSAELAMREFMIEQQRYGHEGGQTPDVRVQQHDIYRKIYRQHVRSSHFARLPSNAGAHLSGISHNTATLATQQPPVVSSMPAIYTTTGMPQSQPPYPGQSQSPQIQLPTPTGAQLQNAQLESQMRIHMQMQMQMNARAHPQAQAAVQSPLPAILQSQQQAASVPAPAYFQNPSGSFPMHFQQPHRSGRYNPASPQEAAQMQALMMYQQQMQLPQHLTPSNSPSTNQRPRPHQANSAIQHPPPRLFFPGSNNSVPQPAQPDYRRSALHQAHMRSPVLGPKQRDASASASSLDSFRRVVGFVLHPQRLTTNPIQEIPFQLPSQEIGKLLRVKANADGDPPSGEFDLNSITLRLRCCEVPPNKPLPTENKWALLDGSWPAQAYFTVNQNALEPRRKLHHGKCLPVDITHCVGADANKLTVRINRLKHDKSAFNYAVAIEVVGFATRDSIKEDCMKHLVPSEQILNSIKKSLTSDDDDIIIQSNLTLRLYEPFSKAKIFDIPVRSQDCLHREAFDLDVFLDTRPRPHSPNDLVSKVDVWKCPICMADSRPQSLIVDGFLVEVRRDLASKNMLNTRSITVESDGSWAPVQETNDDEGSEDEATPAPKKNIEIILIDDD